MSWVLMAAFGLAAWLLVAAFVLGLCRAASRADELGSVRFASDRGLDSLASENNVVDLCAFRAERAGPSSVARPTSTASRAAGP
jgi:hypothetical protein